MTKQEKIFIIELLKDFKENYNFTSKEIAQKLHTTESTVSNWLSGKALPSPTKAKSICKLLDTICIPGIVRIPKNEHWNTTYFLRVIDIKNPYMTWVDDQFSGEEPESFSKWVKDWSIAFPNPTVYRQYAPTSQGRVQCQYDALNLLTTISFKDCFIGHSSLEEVFNTYKGLNPSGFDYKLIRDLMSGEDDGVS